MKTTGTHTFSNLTVIDHPLVQHKLTIMRKTDTPMAEFRRLLKEITMLMAYEITRDWRLVTQPIETPVAAMEAPILAGRKPVVVAIMRAGLGMADGVMEIMPLAREGHIGLYRDHVTKKPKEYFVKLPALDDRPVVVCDPMLATGNSAAHAIDILKDRGVEDARITMLSLVAAPEGVRVMEQRLPNIRVYTASLDERLDDRAYIVPGLGDAGDRFFGTR